MHENGRLAVIYPTEEAKSFQEKAEVFGFFCHRKLYVKPRFESQTKRVLMELGKSQLAYRESAIAIEAARHIYTPEFIALIKDFYLKY